jgi:oxygen-independent coproporphyrinogen-3 oxidase
MVAALKQELEMRKHYLGAGAELDTVYFGGGTPSLLHAEEIGSLLAAIRKHFRLAQDAEITLEANPDELSLEKLRALRELGINRLSIGIQSFREQDLQWMRRAHNAAQALACVEYAREAGFSNFSLDFIFGGPQLSLQAWRENLEQALALQPTHVSLYALTVEDKTLLAHWVNQSKIELSDDALYQQQYLLAHELMTAAGYEHYELSNFARPGFRSRHNTSYWLGTPYLGIGPSAHSYNGQERSWNLANNARYLQALKKGQSPLEEAESLSPTDRYNEFLLTRLRLIEGLDLKEVEARFGVDLMKEAGGYLKGLKEKGLLWQQEDRIGFKPEGWIISDRLISELFR